MSDGLLNHSSPSRGLVQPCRPPRGMVPFEVQVGEKTTVTDPLEVQPDQENLPDEVRIVLADSQPMLVDGTRALLNDQPGLSVVDVALSERALFRAMRMHQPDVLIIEQHLGQRSCFQLIDVLRGEHPDLKTVVFTAEMDARMAIEAVRSHVDGVVLKTMPTELFLACVRKVSAGGRWIEMRSFADAVEQIIARQDATSSLAAVLSPREIEMVSWVAQGLRNKEIARQAHVSEGTVKTHLHNIYDKLGLKSRMELLRFAQEQGLDR
ncbi:MAG: response regulator transcription factor [Pseudomonadota bacterium]|nr:response regulator transcription factor [Pseudomonadota bacterium]